MELPLLETEIWREFAFRGLTAFAISSSSLPPNTLEGVEEFTDSMSLTMTTLVDSAGAVYEDYWLSTADGFAPHPREFIIDRDGIVVYAAATIDPVALREVLEQELD